MAEDLKVYDETTGELLEGPFDYSKGRIYQSVRFVAHHDAQEEVSHEEIMPGTEHMNDGNGLSAIIIDQPAKDAWDEYENCFMWHTFTEEELSSGTSFGTDTKYIMDTIDKKVNSAIVTAVALSKGG